MADIAAALALPSLRRTSTESADRTFRGTFWYLGPHLTPANRNRAPGRRPRFPRTAWFFDLKKFPKKIPIAC
jgi:hypothetical protein